MKLWDKVRPLRLIHATALTASLLLLGGCSCNSVFFWPYPDLVQTPAKGNIDYEDIYITTPDQVRLHGWLLKPSGAVKGRVLFLHGNAENISTHISSIYWLPSHGYEVLMIDYRGYGQSGGEACLPGIITDIEESYRWLDDRNQDELPLFIIGQSLGASLAAYSVGVNQDWDISGLVLDSPFSGYRDIARDKASELWLTWTLQYPLSWLISDTFSPNQTIQGVSPRPLLMFYSEKDKIVPPHLSANLFEQALSPKRRIITSERHIATFLKDRYRNHVLDFLSSPQRNAQKTTAPNNKQPQKT